MMTIMKVSKIIKWNANKNDNPQFNNDNKQKL
jgi:hypothetical protein